MTFIRIGKSLLWGRCFLNYHACMELSYRICILGQQFHH
jgi:hypothetical protein